MRKPKEEGGSSRPSRSFFEYLNARTLSNIDEPVHEILERPEEGVNEDFLYGSLICTSVLQGHTGCVNAMDWCDSGRFLASGSDDQKLLLWSTSQRELFSRVDTVHAQNIFGVCFLVGREDRIVTVAGDGRVQLHQLREDGMPASTTAWHHHVDRAKRVQVQAEEPNLFWTASEDGTIREYDIRLPEDQTGNILADWSEMQISLNSLSISPLRPWYFACGGTGPVVRIFDRRLVNAERRSSNVQFLFDKIWMPLQKAADMTCAVKFRRTSMELIASMINDSVYRMDFDSFNGTPLNETISYLQQEEGRYSQLASKWREGKFDDYYFAISELIGEHRNLQYGIIRYLNAIFAREVEARMLVAIHLNRVEEALSDADILWSNEAELDASALHGAFLVFLLSERHRETCQEMLERREELDSLSEFLDQSREQILTRIRLMSPIFIPEMSEWKQVLKQKQIYFGFEQRYSGHINVQTVKDVTFLGSRDDYVASGSDAGFFFIWHRETADLVFVGRSDNHVVNAIVEHPKLPILAVSGIDNDIKIWEPGQGLDDDRQMENWRAVPVEYRSRLLEQLQSIDHIVPMITIPCHIQ